METSGNPDVSVVIPTYNRANLIGRAIKSVLSQTYQNFEIIIVDDCSSDDTENVVKVFTGQKIRYIKHSENKGVGAARNTGIAAAEGQFIAFLDSDDEWMPEKLKKQVNKIQSSSSKVGIVYCAVSMVLERTGKVMHTMMPQVRGDASRATLRYCVLGSCTVPLIRRECFERCGLFDEDPALAGLEDWDMWMRIAKYYEFDFIPDTLAKRYIHGEQLTTTLDQKIRARNAILKKHGDELTGYSSILADHLNRLGILYCAAGDLVEGKRYFWESVRVRPVQKFVYKYLLPLLLAPQVYYKMLKKDISKKSIDGIPLYW